MTEPKRFLIYQSEDGELAEDAVVRFFQTTAANRKQYEVAHYNLDMMLAPGFFEQHCALFHYRPFIWHAWDFLKNGFNALVNYHKLTHARLENPSLTQDISGGKKGAGDALLGNWPAHPTGRVEIKAGWLRQADCRRTAATIGLDPIQSRRWIYITYPRLRKML